jgi:hypothetical protein
MLDDARAKPVMDLRSLLSTGWCRLVRAGSVFRFASRLQLIEWFRARRRRGRSGWLATFSTVCVPGQKPYGILAFERAVFRLFSLVGAGRFERPTPCAQGGFRPSSRAPCLQMLTFQADAGILLKPIEPCWAWRLRAATELSTIPELPCSTCSPDCGRSFVHAKTSVSEPSLGARLSMGGTRASCTSG